MPSPGGKPPFPFSWPPALAGLCNLPAGAVSEHHASPCEPSCVTIRYARTVSERKRIIDLPWLLTEVRINGVIVYDPEPDLEHPALTLSITPLGRALHTSLSLIGGVEQVTVGLKRIILKLSPRHTFDDLATEVFAVISMTTGLTPAEMCVKFVGPINPTYRNFGRLEYPKRDSGSSA